MIGRGGSWNGFQNRGLSVFSGSTYEGLFDCAKEEIKCEISFHCLAAGGLGEIKRYGYVVLWDIKDRH